MQQYALTILSFAAIAFLANLLFPSENEKLKKPFTLALALLFFVVLLRPLATLADFSLSQEDFKTGDLSSIIEEAEGETMEKIEGAVGKGIASDSESRFSLPPGSVSASPTLVLTENELTVTRLTVAVAYAGVDGIAIRDYVRKNYTENCEVTTGGR